MTRKTAVRFPCRSILNLTPQPPSLAKRSERPGKGEQIPSPPSNRRRAPHSLRGTSEQGKGAGGLGFFRYAAIGAELLALHRDYETAPEYRLTAIENKDVPYQWRIEKMKLSKDRTQIIVNESLTLGGVPPAAFEYRLGNRSALEWALDQYQVTTDKRSGLTSDPNRDESKDYIVALLGKVITVSLETMRLVNELESLTKQ